MNDPAVRSPQLVTPQHSSAPIAGPTWITTFRDAAIVVLLAVLLALGVNFLRTTNSIVLIAKKPYQVLVPCPEYRGAAKSIDFRFLAFDEKGLLIIDARPPEAYQRGHLPGARSIPFDYLEPVSPPLLAQVLKRQPRRVVVYGDGENPDSGEQLARELSGQGIKNVFYIKGGAAAVRSRFSTRPRP